ncbi:cytochrome c biogenesis CcdA family protein [Gemelliphila palaticanis]|uniref:Cytochrome c biogenesis protein CcdA n=1 Tax=Gemelliphila palaticanis TaxID=81950 RepID=A0ABX2SXA7_9BACL|nr:cytochrome c biogenesis CcdA family protein [Gemella palaticanis]MBF0714840.1 cytochrome c biogenesis protein CcdA [Gemella palaticanis]NYS46770.1 cytochrome c biogenesis protein CcdA [Gemella palaticanis]
MDINIIKIITLFLEGILSFFSPCIIPIIPIYMTILSKNNKDLQTNNSKLYKLKNSLNSVFFIIGVSTTFFIIAFTTSYISMFLNDNIRNIQIISGILIIIMGLSQLGILNIKFLNNEFSLKNKLKLKDKKINIAISFFMGFTFSFSWTPCIGPIMSSVILYASTHNSYNSFLLICTYSIGFIIPFILMAIFTTKIIIFIKQHPKIIKNTVLLSGIILILIGISIITGDFNKLVIKYFM